MDFCFCFWIIGRDEVQQREKNNFCTFYTHISSISANKYTPSLTRILYNTYKETALVKKRLNLRRTSSVHVRVQHVCSNRGLLPETLRFGVQLHMATPSNTSLTKICYTTTGLWLNGTAVTCVPFLFFFFVCFFCLCSYKQTKQEGKCKYSSITFCVSAL